MSTLWSIYEVEYLRIIYLLKFQPLNLSKYLIVPYLSLVFLSVIPFLYLDIVFGSINWLKLSAEGINMIKTEVMIINAHFTASFVM